MFKNINIEGCVVFANFSFEKRVIDFKTNDGIIYCLDDSSEWKEFQGLDDVLKLSDKTWHVLIGVYNLEFSKWIKECEEKLIYDLVINRKLKIDLKELSYAFNEFIEIGILDNTWSEDTGMTLEQLIKLDNYIGEYANNFDRFYQELFKYLEYNYYELLDDAGYFNNEE